MFECFEQPAWQLLSAIALAIAALCVALCASPATAEAVEPDDGNAIAVVLGSAQTVNGHEYAQNTLILCRTTSNVQNATSRTVTDIYGNSYTGMVFTGIESTNEVSTANCKWYTYRTSIVAVDIADNTTIRPLCCAYWFLGHTKLGLCDLNGLDTSRVTDMTYMFAESWNASFQVTGLADWDTSNVIHMPGMFQSCSGAGFTAPQVSGWNVSKVEDMSRMFQGCRGAAFTAPNVSNWNTQSVTNMNAMFKGCSGAAFTVPDVSKWNTSNVTNMSAMFQECSGANFTAPDMSSWDTSKVTDASNMFYLCQGASFTSIDISHWSITSLTNISSMFSNCSNLVTIYAAPGADWSGVASGANMFATCPKLVGGEGTSNPAGVDVITSAYARIDDRENGKPGYFTAKALPPADPGATATDAVPFAHTMKAGASVDLTGITYTISGTPTSLSGTNSALVTEGVREVPNAASFTSFTIEPASATQDAASTEWTRIYPVDKTLPQLFGSADNFGIPGVYLFDVSEVASGGSSQANDGATPTPNALWTNASESYRLRVYVANDDSNEGHLAYSWWTIEDLSDNAKVDSMAFSSSYEAWQTLDIVQYARGNFANLLFDFPIQVTVYLPDWYDGNTDIVYENATETSAPARVGEEGPYIGVYDMALRDSETASVRVPVGSYYKIEEFGVVPGSDPVLVQDSAGIHYAPNIAWREDGSSGGDNGSGSDSDPAPSIPASLSTASLSELQAVSAGLRSHTVQPSAVSGLIGETVTVTFADSNAAVARLVDATAERGLVFQFNTTGKFNTPIATGGMNSSDTNSGGWASSAMRTRLNSGDIYTSKLQGMTIAGEVVDPVATTLKSLDYNGGSPQVITTTGDKFWLASVTEIYGTDAWATMNTAWTIGYSGTEDCAQFAYYASLNTDPLNYDFMTNPLSSGTWRWLRSASPRYENEFMIVSGNGDAAGSLASYTGGIAPCFCL